MIRQFFYILYFFTVCISFGCTTWEKLYKAKLSDGTYVQISRPANKSGYRYLSGVRGKYNSLHHEYLVNIFNCDTIIKKIYAKGHMVKILILTTDENPGYLITDEDRLIFQKSQPYMDPSNKCYQSFIDKAKRYKVHYEGKVKRNIF